MMTAAETNLTASALAAHYDAVLSAAFKGTGHQAILKREGDMLGLLTGAFTLYVDGGTNESNARAMVKAVGLVQGLTEARLRRVTVGGKRAWRAATAAIGAGDIRRGIRWSESMV